jgi:TolA-binding protein
MNSTRRIPTPPSRNALWLVAALCVAGGLVLSTPGRAERKPPKKAAASRAGKPGANEVKLARAEDAFTHGRADEARGLLAAIPAGSLPRGSEETAAYLRAAVAPSGPDHSARLTEYLRAFPDGKRRREATLLLAKIKYVEGDYGAAENLLSIFSPGVEKNAVGREAIVTRGLAELARGDAAGAYQFLLSAEEDLKGSEEEEAYYFAVSQAALRAAKPAEAMEALKVVLDRHAQGDYAPQALYAMGVSLEAVGRGADATSVFRQVAQRFPDSYEAARVRDRGIRPGGPTAGVLPIGGGFAIQVGAFSRRDLAESLARDLRQAGVGSVSVKQGSETTPIYRVRAGSFASRDEARALGERLRRERGFSYQVVPR